MQRSALRKKTTVLGPDLLSRKTLQQELTLDKCTGTELDDIAAHHHHHHHHQGFIAEQKIQQTGRMHVISPRTLGFGGFFWHGAWDWGVERVCKCVKGNRLRSRGVLV